MEESIYGQISYSIAGKRYEEGFQQGSRELPGGLWLHFESIFEEESPKLYIRTVGEAELHSLYIDLEYEENDIRTFFANGFQSWTESRPRPVEDKVSGLASPFPKLMNQSGDYTFYRGEAKNGRLHSHALTWTRGRGNRSHAFVEHHPETGHTIFELQAREHRVRILKDVAGLRVSGETEVMYIRTGKGKELEALRNALTGFTPRPARGPVTGWTSWYNYYTDIDQDIILQNLDAIVRLKAPLDYFQIDDGWQPAVGDWMEANEKFPKGMKDIADRVHRHGLQAGLWLAPFIVDQRSALFEAHRDWLLTYDGEHLVAGGFNPLWGGIGRGRYFVLDIFKEEVRAHLRAVFDRVIGEWGYDLLKLDFLYAVALLPRLGRSRGTIMDEAMAFLRECCGEKAILGCGVPLAQAFGKVEYCRIGADIGLNWDMKSLKMMGLRERISTVNSLRSTISRRALSGKVFLNDPDVFILREENNKLDPRERHSLFALNLALGDLVFTSDNLANYSPEILRKYRSQFPNRPKEILEIRSEGDFYKIRLAVQDREYLLLANLGNNKQETELDDFLYFNVEMGFCEGLLVLEKHETKVLLKVDFSNAILASDRHLFPASEFEAGATNMDQVHPEALSEGLVYCAVRNPISQEAFPLPVGRPAQTMSYSYACQGGGTLEYAIVSME